MGLKLKRGREEYQEIQKRLESRDYQLFDMSDNETAKLHVRYMVGGRPPSLINERLFSFEFPEQPGALLNFLTTLGEQWDITLFHYRNHGAAEGLVLAGFDIPDADLDLFYQHLQMLNYTFEEQTQNPAYKFFLSDLNGVF